MWGADVWGWRFLGGYQGLVTSIWYLVRLEMWMGWSWVKSLTLGAVVAGGVDALNDADS